MYDDYQEPPQPVRTREQERLEEERSRREERAARERRRKDKQRRREEEEAHRRNILDSLRQGAKGNGLLDFNKRMEMSALHSELAHQDVEIVSKQTRSNLLEPQIKGLERDTKALQSEINEVKDRNNKIEYKLAEVDFQLESKAKEKELLMLRLENRQEKLK